MKISEKSEKRDEERIYWSEVHSTWLMFDGDWLKFLIYYFALRFQIVVNCSFGMLNSFYSKKFPSKIISKCQMVKVKRSSVLAVSHEAHIT